MSREHDSSPTQAKRSSWVVADIGAVLAELEQMPPNERADVMWRDVEELVPS